MTHSKILEARFATFKELREEFIKAAELVGLTIIRRNFVKEFLNLTEGERPPTELEFDRIFTSGDPSPDVHVFPSDRENSSTLKKDRKIYIKLSDGETTFSPLGLHKRTAQYGLLSEVDLRDLWAVDIRKNGYGSFKIVKGQNVSSIEVDMGIGVITVLDSSQKEEVKEPSSDRSVLPNIQPSGRLEEISTLFTMLDKLTAVLNPEKLVLSIAILRTLLTLIVPSSRETSYLKDNLTSFFNGWDGNPKTIPPALIYVGAIGQWGSRNLDTDARWIVATLRRICHFIEEREASQKKPFTETPKVSEDETSHSLTVGIEKANHLMEERNTIITALAFSRISEGGSTIFDTAAAERLKQLSVPGEDVYSALLHYHSRLMFYSLKVGFESPLLSDLKAILYAGMPKTYLEFDEKVDKEIVFLFAEGGEKQRSEWYHHY